MTPVYQAAHAQKTRNAQVYSQRMAAISLVCQHCPDGPECVM
jgi:hypothetical protein